MIKHRDHCGDIRNHIQIQSIEYEVFDEDSEQPTKVAYIMMRWEGGEDAYLYEEEVEGEIDEAEAREIVASQATPK